MQNDKYTYATATLAQESDFLWSIVATSAELQRSLSAPHLGDGHARCGLYCVMCHLFSFSLHINVIKLSLQC